RWCCCCARRACSARRAATSPAMLRHRRFVVEALTALGLVAAPYVLPPLGFAPNTVNQIMVWGLFGIGFDILFGYTGMLSFGQAAFYGTGGFVAAYLLTNNLMSNVLLALVVGTLGAMLAGIVVGAIALRRTGIYFAMITVAIAEVSYFTEFSPLAAYTGGENGLPGVPTPTFYLGFTTITFDTSGQLVMQTAIGGAGTLFGPLVGAALWLYLQDFLQSAFNLGAAWKLVLGIVFVLLVCFLRRGIVGGIVDLVSFVGGAGAPKVAAAVAPRTPAEAARQPAIAAMPARRHALDGFTGPILQ